MLTAEKNFYEILGLERRASLEEIRSAYRKLAARFHPDRHPEHADRFLEINQAYLTLSEPDKRKDYDRTLRAPSQEEKTLGERIAEAFKRGYRRRTPGKHLRARKVVIHPPGTVPFKDFSPWMKHKLRKEFKGCVLRSYWRQERMGAREFVGKHIKPYGFKIRPEILVELGQRFRQEKELLTTFFVDLLNEDPVVWGKHRAVVAAELAPTLPVVVYVRVS